MSDSEKDSDVSLPPSGDEELSRSSSSGVDIASGSGSSDENDDEVVENIILRQEARSINPKEIEIAHTDLVTDLCFHPNDDRIALAFHTGVVDIYEVSDDTNKLQSFPVHTDSCRGVDFFQNGLKMVTVSRSGSVSWTDVNKGKSKEISSDPNNLYLTLKILDASLFATGDENGTVMLWDIRSPDNADKMKDLDQAINQIHYAENRRRLLCATGDGDLLVYDVRMSGKMKLAERSEAFTSELTSVTTVRSENHIICGSGSGELLLFDWWPFDYQTYKPVATDRELLSLQAVSDNIVIAGYENGRLYAVHLYPNKVIGLVGHHSGSCAGVTALDINSGGNIVASAAETVKFWNITYLEEAHKFVDDKAIKNKTEVNLPSSQIMSRQSFFSDLNEDKADDSS